MWEIDLLTNKNLGGRVDDTQCNLMGAYENKNERDHSVLHACAFSPVKSTWLKAIKRGFFITWPGLTVHAVEKYLGKIDATVKGHLHQQRMNMWSTNGSCTRQIVEGYEPCEDFEAKLEERTNLIYVTVEETREIFTDQTGVFPVTSSMGNKYVIICYAYDQNAIIARPGTGIGHCVSDFVRNWSVPGRAQGVVALPERPKNVAKDEEPLWGST